MGLRIRIHPLIEEQGCISVWFDQAVVGVVRVVSSLGLLNASISYHGILLPPLSLCRTNSTRYPKVTQPSLRSNGNALPSRQVWGGRMSECRVVVELLEFGDLGYLSRSR